jgi:hypothetical protein
MSIAGAWMALGARLIAKWTVYPIRGVGPLRNEKPRMGVRGSLGEGLIGPLNRTMISGVPGFRFWISEFRIPYGIWEIRNTAPCTRGPRGRTWASRGRILAGCNGVGHWVSYSGVLCK